MRLCKECNCVLTSKELRVCLTCINRGFGSKSNEQNYMSGTTPTYYTGKYKGIKVIDFIFDFELHHNLASCVEYIARAGKKDDEKQDIQKAINHLEMYKEYLSLKDDI